MNDFLRGMATIGNLNPDPMPARNLPGPSDAWRGVAAAFAQTGNNLRDAIKEFEDAQRKKQQRH